MESNSRSLKEVFKQDFLIGAALNRRQFSEADAREVAIIREQFNSITPENQLKWAMIHPRPETYDFAGADQYVSFGEKYQMFIVGHTLIWHRQTPDWVFKDAGGRQVDRATLLARMRDHILTVVGRYKGRIKGWDVVNEAVNEDGSLRKSPWLEIIGPDYIQIAYQIAHEADPDAQLYYNDYELENEPKRNGAIKLIKQLQEKGVQIAAVGLQGHDNLTWPTVQQQNDTIEAFANLGIKVNITELDINVLPRVPEEAGLRMKLDENNSKELNPYAAGLPSSVDESQAKRYAELFTSFRKHHDVIDRVTFWGVSDGDSWLNNWPVRGRTNYPLLFDRDRKPKTGFEAILRVADSSR